MAATVRSEKRTRLSVRPVGPDEAGAARTTIRSPETIAAAKIPVPVNESQLKVKTADSAVSLATTGGTR